MPNSRVVYVMLTGGLGNQLFQLAGGLSRGGKKCFLDVSLANPRKNSSGEVDIFEFDLGPDVEFYTTTTKTRVTSKAANFILRSGMKPRKIEKWRLSRFLAKVLVSILLSMRVRNSVNVLQGLDNGYFEIANSKKNEFLIGYFQSFRWFTQSQTLRKMQNLKLKAESLVLEEFLKLDQSTKNVMMHVRLGDYKNEKDFGIPSARYYESALKQLEEDGKLERIWLFSDEPEAALQYVPEKYSRLVRVVPDFHGSSAITLEAMRHANSYVIANSTLSWWGASLSYSENPTVIAPAPWFKTKPEPKEIIPHYWNRMEALY